MKQTSNAGLVQLRSEKQAARCRVKLLVYGEIASPNNAIQTQVIIDVMTNQLIDESWLPWRSFVHVPRLHAYCGPPSFKLLLNQVDARYYFYVLAAGGGVRNQRIYIRSSDMQKAQRKTQTESPRKHDHELDRKTPS